MNSIITEKDGNCLVKCQIQPSASKNAIIGIHNQTLKISLTAPPVDGKANKDLCKYISKLSGIPKSKINIIKGEKSRSKTLLLEGIKAENLKKILIND